MSSGPSPVLSPARDPQGAPQEARQIFWFYLHCKEEETESENGNLCGRRVGVGVRRRGLQSQCEWTCQTPRARL